MTTVLIVEDDPLSLRVFTKILTKRGGFQVKGTENVEEILQISSSKKADVILMDVSLSNSFYQGKAVDGLKICKLLKSNPQTAKIPVMLVSAHAMSGDRESFLNDSGADGYIKKPIIDHQQFVDQIQELATKTIDNY